MKNLLIILFSFALGFLICGVLLNYKKVETVEQKEIQKVQCVEQTENRLYKLLKFEMCRDTLSGILFKSWEKWEGITGAKKSLELKEKLYDEMIEIPDTLEILTACEKLKLISE